VLLISERWVPLAIAAVHSLLKILSSHELHRTSICTHNRYVHTARRSLAVQTHSLCAFTSIRRADQGARWKYRWSRPVSWFVSFLAFICDSSQYFLIRFAVICFGIGVVLTDACATQYMSPSPPAHSHMRFRNCLQVRHFFSDSQNRIN